MGLEMIEVFRADMLGFFEEMAAEADGWDGLKSWRSEFAEMHVDAENPGRGAVSLSIRLRPPNEELDFDGKLDVRADAFAQAAEDLRAFLGLSEGRRFVRRR